MEDIRHEDADDLGPAGDIYLPGEPGHPGFDEEETPPTGRLYGSREPEEAETGSGSAAGPAGGAPGGENIERGDSNEGWEPSEE